MLKRHAVKFYIPSRFKKKKKKTTNNKTPPERGNDGCHNSVPHLSFLITEKPPHS